MPLGHFPFPHVLGQAFETLPREVRETHLTRDRSEWVGRGSVERGRGLWSRMIASLFGFPRQTPDVEVRVVKTAVSEGEIWDRRFGDKTFRSHLFATPTGMTERFGPFTFRLGLHVTSDGALHYPVIAGRLGPLPLPKWSLPRSDASERARDGRFRFDVTLRAPLTGGLIVRYEGWLEPAGRGVPRPPSD